MGWVMKLSLKHVSLLTLICLFVCICLLPVTAQDGGNPTMPTPAVPATPTAIPRPQPTTVLNENGTTLEVYFSSLAQGSAGLLHVTGANVAGAKSSFLDDLVDFYPIENDGFYGLVSVSMEQTARNYNLDVLVWYVDGTRQTISTKVDVTVGAFIKQVVNLPPDKGYLADPEIERNEFAKLEAIFSPFTPQRMWDNSGFQLPIPGGELTSPFGAFRNFNGNMDTRHTGWDIKATLGQPVMASASGTVAYTGLMDIRGNIVVVNHGMGVFSTYNHFSQTHVTRGQSITAGQVLGVVGNTGRTSGPHFHWEIVVNGNFIDPIEFSQMWKP
jgi:murein DD-endopeptidase MepM/ murein hydrolase activator NlpD